MKIFASGKLALGYAYSFAFALVYIIVQLKQSSPSGSQGTLLY